MCQRPFRERSQYHLSSFTCSTSLIMLAMRVASCGYVWYASRIAGEKLSPVVVWPLHNSTHCLFSHEHCCARRVSHTIGFDFTTPIASGFSPHLLMAKVDLLFRYSYHPPIRGYAYRIAGLLSSLLDARSCVWGARALVCVHPCFLRICLHVCVSVYGV